MTLLQNDETLLLNEGKTGWHKTLAVTNKRLLFLNKDKIEKEFQLSNVLEVYPETQSFTGLTKLVIKFTDGTAESIIFKTGDSDLLLGGLDFAGSNASNMANRYVNMINRVLNQK
jgi:hypothetical protein